MMMNLLEAAKKKDSFEVSSFLLSHINIFATFCSSLSSSQTKKSQQEGHEK
jgi:hypothetical protein